MNVRCVHSQHSLDPLSALQQDFFQPEWAAQALSHIVQSRQSLGPGAQVIGLLCYL
jgi:hypothetical protein